MRSVPQRVRIGLEADRALFVHSLVMRHKSWTQARSAAPRRKTRKASFSAKCNAENTWHLSNFVLRRLSVSDARHSLRIDANPEGIRRQPVRPQFPSGVGVSSRDGMRPLLRHVASISLARSGRGDALILMIACSTG